MANIVRVLQLILLAVFVISTGLVFSFLLKFKLKIFVEIILYKFFK